MQQGTTLYDFNEDYSLNLLEIQIELIMPSILLTIMVLFFLAKSTSNQENEKGYEENFENFNEKLSRVQLEQKFF